MSLPDHDRPLNKRGKQAAPLMGKRLKNKAIHPQKIISSSANRALKTAHLTAQQLNYPSKDIVIDSNLYHASTYEMLKIIAQTSDDIDKLMLVAHNPGITSLCNQLLENNHHYFANIPTAGLVTISIAVNNWRQITKTTISAAQIKINLIDYDYPKLAT